MYSKRNEKGSSDEWLKIMKNTIASNAGRYSTSRMLQDYVEKMYIPLCNLSNKYYKDLDEVANLNEWKDKMTKHFEKIEIKQSESNYNDITIDAGNKITVGCEVKLPNKFVTIDSIQAEVFYGKITTEGIVNDIQITKMDYDGEEDGIHKFSAKIELKSGGDYGYTFRVVPKNSMIPNVMDLNLIKWITD